MTGDGALAAPAPAAAIDVDARTGGAALAIGHRAYVLAGQATASMEEAAIAGDGALGDFAATTSARPRASIRASPSAAITRSWSAARTSRG